MSSIDSVACLRWFCYNGHINNIHDYRTRVVNSNRKRAVLYAKTTDELYEKVEEANRLAAELVFRKSSSTVTRK